MNFELQTTHILPKRRHQRSRISRCEESNEQGRPCNKREIAAVFVVVMLACSMSPTQARGHMSTIAPISSQRSQAKPETTPRTITGRLVDDKKNPLTDAVVRPCRQAKSPDGSVQTFFAKHTNGTWATPKTDATGTFTFEGDLAPGKYCLAVESGGTMTILKGPTGEPLEFEVTKPPAKVDWGEIVVRGS